MAQRVGICGVQLKPLADALLRLILNHSVIQADETPVPMLAPGKQQTHRAYIWAYSTTAFTDPRAVVYHFAPSRSGEHVR